MSSENSDFIKADCSHKDQLQNTKLLRKKLIPKVFKQF